MNLHNLLSQQQIVKRNLPLNVTEKDLKYFRLHLYRVIPEIIIDKAKNCLVFGTGVVYTNKFLPDSLLYYDQHIQKDFYLKTFFSGLLKVRFRLFTRNKIAFVTNEWSNNYFHWFTEVIPRIILIKSLYPDITFLFLFKLNEQYQLPSIKQLGIKFYSRKLHFAYIRNLLFSNAFANLSGHYDPMLIKEVRSIFKSSTNRCKDAPELIYLYREGHKRKIVNNDLVNLTFKNFGFEIKSFESVSLAEQIGYMSNAKVLASVHGAGLTNMLFVPENTKILELSKENEVMDKCYFNLASALDLDYWYLFCKAENDHDSYVNCNLIVDIQKLKNTLIHILAI